jgi:hypothetical protein
MAGRSKLGNKKIVVNGIEYDSKMEYEFHLILLAEKQQGKIAEIEIQPKYELLPAFEKMGKKHRAMTYSPDFLVTYPDGRKVVIDVKGHPNDRFPLKKKLFDFNYPDLELIVMKKVNKFGGWLTEENYKKQKRIEKKVEKKLEQRVNKKYKKKG